MSRADAGAAIRMFRESRGMSLAQLSAASGVSTMGLSYLERGVRKPRNDTIRKLEVSIGFPSGTYHRLVNAKGFPTPSCRRLPRRHAHCPHPRPW